MPTTTRRSRAEKRSHTATTGGADATAAASTVNKAARLSLDHTQANSRSALKDISNRRPQSHVNAKDTRAVTKVEATKDFTRSKRAAVADKENEVVAANSNKRVSTSRHSTHSTSSLLNVSSHSTSRSNGEWELLDPQHHEDDDDDEDEEDDDEDSAIYDQEEEIDDEESSTLEPPSKPLPSSKPALPSTSTTTSTAASPDSSSATSPSSYLSQTYQPPTPSPSEVSSLVSQWQQSTSSLPSDYSSAILSHLIASETSTLPPHSYMDTVQGDLSFPMRSILLDWLNEVAQEYHLQPQTLFLSTAYIDRFLSHTPIDRRRLQLVGITCTLIAAKYWEIHPPTIEEFVYISDHTYDREQVLEMERAVLTCLKFRLTVPTAWEFGRRLGKECGMDGVESAMTDYLLEGFVQEGVSLQYRPSVIAAAAAYLAMSTVGKRGDVMGRVREASGYEYRELKQCVQAVWAMHDRLFHDPNGVVAAGSTGFKAVKDKYSSSKLHGVSKLKPRQSIAEIK